jgi:hypothetical protein
MKTTSKAGQRVTFYQYLQTRIETASMIAEATGIPQKNICRYKRFYEKRGQLAEVRKGKCWVTGYKANFITTNRDYFPKDTQTDLFEGVTA